MTTITRTSQEKQWRKNAALSLHYAGYPVEAEAFFFCGNEDKFSAYAVCSQDFNHFATPINHTCHLRYCPDCEKRSQAERMTKYLPAIEDCANFPKHGYSLKHLILTTPYSLESETAVEDYRKAWSAVHSTIESVFYEVRRQYATSEEKRRKRISLKLHGIGLVVAAEYGEKGNKLHFHCLLYSPYVPIGIIPQHWKEQTGGDCTVTRIRKVNDAHAGAKEIICKYVTKFTELDPGLVPMLHKVLFGSRRIRTYGIFFNLPDIEEERLCLCPVCDSGLKYIRRQDYDIATGRVISTYLDKLEISRGKDPPHGGNNGVSGTSQTPQETFAQLVMGGFDAEHLLKRPKGHYSQD